MTTRLPFVRQARPQLAPPTKRLRMSRGHAVGLEPVMSEQTTVPVRRRWLSSSGFGMLALGAALAMGFAYAAQSVSRAMIAMRTASTIKVKGTASVDLTSDRAVWKAVVTARGATLPEAYGRLNTGVERLKRFVTENGFAPEEIRPEAVDTGMTHARDTKGNELPRIESYTLSQSVAVLSDKVEKVKQLSERATELIKEGVRRVYPVLKFEIGQSWMGNRPTTPDSLPVIGATEGAPNILHAYGGQHIGLTIGAKVGRIVADLARRRRPNLDLRPYRPDRF